MLAVVSGSGLWQEVRIYTLLSQRVSELAQSGSTRGAFFKSWSTGWRLICCQSMTCLEAQLYRVNLPLYPLSSASLPSCVAKQACSQVEKWCMQLFVSGLYHLTWDEFILSPMMPAWQLWKGCVGFFFIFYIELCIVIFVSLPGSEYGKVRLYKCVVVSPLHVKILSALQNLSTVIHEHHYF